MRARALVTALGLILALLAGQALIKDIQSDLDPPVVAACTVQGEGCDQPPLDGRRQSLLSHRILRDGCPGADLHVMEFIDVAGAQPLVASWCN